MQQKDDSRTEVKHPSEMTTDEALDYVFAPEIADALRKEAMKGDEPEEPES
ncbi:MAG: hypothetical protein QOJ64_2974 [Acidobacteriota bacterium]|jgi:hypothetical protein|nr:hypothetical protein [Acidobacteriota bacterium]